MAKRAIRSFTVKAGGRVFSIHPSMVFADSHPLTTEYASLFEDITEITAAALAAPTVTAGDPTDTTCNVTWTAVSGAGGYTVTTTPATSTYSVSGLEVDLVGLTPETLYTVNVVALSDSVVEADSTAGTDSFTTDVAA